jgi:hypothetical protein
MLELRDLGPSGISPSDVRKAVPVKWPYGIEQDKYLTGQAG